MPLGQEPRVTPTDRRRATRFVHNPRNSRFVGAPTDSRFGDTPGEGRP